MPGRSSIIPIRVGDPGTATLDGPNGKVPYAWSGDYEDGSDEQGPYVRISALVNWSDRFDFVNTMRGHVIVAGGSQGGIISWPVIPVYPDSKNLRCVSCAMKEKLGVGSMNAAGGVDYDFAIYDVAYRRPQYDYNGTEILTSINGQAYPFLTFRKRSFEEQVAIPAAALQFQDPAAGPGGGGNLDEPMYVTIPVIEILASRKFLPYLPGIEQDVLAGSVNNDVFLGYPAGTVKFGGVSSEREIDGVGNPVTETEWSFHVKPFDWNSKWSPVRGMGFRLVWSNDGAGHVVFPHPYADFSIFLGTEGPD